MKECASDSAALCFFPFILRYESRFFKGKRQRSLKCLPLIFNRLLGRTQSNKKQTKTKKRSPTQSEFFRSFQLQVLGEFPNFQVMLTTVWQSDGNLIKYADDTQLLVCALLLIPAVCGADARYRAHSSNMEKMLVAPLQ